MFRRSGGGLVELSVKGVRHPILVRTCASEDLAVLRYVFYNQYHRPPREIEFSGHCTIVDLGCNIGLSIVDFKATHPNSTVIGYEMDSENFALALRNCEDYDNVRLHNKAVWTERGRVRYDHSTATDAFSISHSAGEPGDAAAEAESLTMADVVSETGRERIDYLKMDIEGAERQILKSQDLSWLQRVDAVSIELHGVEDGLDDYLKILTAQGFDAWRHQWHWSAIVAKRKRHHS